MNTKTHDNEATWDALKSQDARWGRVKTAINRLVSRHEDWIHSRVEYRLTGDKIRFVLRVWSHHGHYLGSDHTSSVYCDGAEAVIPLTKDPYTTRYVPDLISSGHTVAEGSHLRYQTEGAGSLVRWAEDTTDGGGMFEAQIPTGLLVDVYEKHMPLYWNDPEEYSHYSLLTPETLDLIPAVLDEGIKLSDWERDLLEGENK